MNRFIYRMMSNRVTKNDTSAKEGYKKTKLGWIPEEWSTPEISEVFNFLRTSSFSRNQLNYEKDSHTFYIHYGDIHATYKTPILDFDKVQTVPKLNDDIVLPCTVEYLKDGDVIIADASEDYEGVGTAIELININDRKVISGLHTFAFRDKTYLTAEGFRTYIFKNPQVKKALKTIATGSKVYGISKSNVQKFKIVLPPLPEQQKIAQILATWDKAIALQEKLIAEKQALKKGLMQQLLTGKKRFAGFEGDWEVVRLGKLVKINPKTGELPKEFEYISLESVKKGRLKNTASLKSMNAPSRAQRVLSKNDILFQTVRPYQMNNYYFDFTGNYVASSGYAQLRCSSEISKFVYYLIHEEYFVNQVLSRCTGSNYPAINPSSLGKIRVKVPKSTNERIAISKGLTVLDLELKKYSKKLNQLKKQKQGLMQQLLTGEKRVKI